MCPILNLPLIGVNIIIYLTARILKIHITEYCERFIGSSCSEQTYWKMEWKWKFVAIISMNGMHLRTQLKMKYKSLITKHILHAQWYCKCNLWMITVSTQILDQQYVHLLKNHTFKLSTVWIRVFKVIHQTIWFVRSLIILSPGINKSVNERWRSGLERWPHKRKVWCSNPSSDETES